MATVTKGKTFISGETVEPADMHQLVDAATVTNIVDADIGSGAAIAASKLAGTLDLSSKTVTLPDANVTPAKLSQPLTLATAQNTTSGTSINFPAIPSWARRITVAFNGVSTNGSSRLAVQLGTSSGLTTTGYTSFTGTFGRTTENFQNTDRVTSGFGWWHAAPIDAGYGNMILINVSGNTWVSSHSGGVSGGSGGSFDFVILGGGSVALSGTLTQLSLTTVSGDTFDAGSVNIMYEG
jgi:hypothetical protein